MMNGGFAVAAVLILFALLAAGLFVRNMRGMLAALKMRSDSKLGRLIELKAAILWSSPARIGSSRAVAEYFVGGRKIKGRMICSSAERLKVGQTVKIFVSESKPRFFIVRERQLDSAVSAYVVMCVVFLAVTAVLIGAAALKAGFR